MGTRREGRDRALEPCDCGSRWANGLASLSPSNPSYAGKRAQPRCRAPTASKEAWAIVGKEAWAIVSKEAWAIVSKEAWAIVGKEAWAIVVRRPGP